MRHTSIAVFAQISSGGQEVKIREIGAGGHGVGYVKHLDEPARSRFCEKIAHPCVLVLIRDVSVNGICEKTTSLHHMFRCSDWL